MIFIRGRGNSHTSTVTLRPIALVWVGIPILGDETIEINDGP